MTLMLPFADSAQIIARWPAGLPLLHLGGTERYHYFAVAFDEVEGDLEFDLNPSDSSPSSTYRSGYLGIRSYDNQCPNRLFRVHSYLVCDQVERKSWLSLDLPNKSEHLLPIADLKELLSLPHTPRPDYQEWQLEKRCSDQDYLNNVERALEDIRSGRYYQINLLRYFNLQHNPSLAELGWRLQHQAEPYTALIATEDLRVASFSPERFVRLASEDGVLVAQTWPIKGTAARHRDPQADTQAAQALLRSDKDQAELHMIVDLMRNDLSRICLSGTVSVDDAGSLQSFANVHHLIACISGDLKPGLTSNDLWQALSPAGSITGAPKKEVIEAIACYETGPRGYFMGHIFVWDDQGIFDSSILIRTLVKEGPKPYAFAAGSGIVIHSEPTSEMAEVAAKCRAVTVEW